MGAGISREPTPLFPATPAPNPALPSRATGLLPGSSFPRQVSPEHGCTGPHLANDSGAVTDSYEYDAFGNLLRSTGSTPNEYRYNGERWDAGLGLQYLRARYVNPATDRFLTMDPAAPNLEGPLTLHRYLYANANPLNARDPSGLITAQEYGYEVENVIAPVYLYEHGQTRATVIFGDMLTNLFGIRLKPDIVNLWNLVENKPTWEEIKPLSVSGVTRGGISAGIYAKALGPLGFDPEAWEPFTQPLPVFGEPTFFFATMEGVLFYTSVIDVANDLAFGAGAYTIQLIRDTVQKLPKKAMAGAAVGVFAAAAAIITSVETKEVEEGVVLAFSRPRQSCSMIAAEP